MGAKGKKDKSAKKEEVTFNQETDEYVFTKIIPVEGSNGREEKKEVSFKVPRKRVEDPLMKVFQIKKQLHCNTFCSDVKRIVQELGLDVPTEFNPKLAFNEGDIAFYAEGGYDLVDLIYELTSRKLALQALDVAEKTLALPKAREKWQGELSALADSFQEVIDMDGKFNGFIETYPDCIPGQPVISFTINKERTCFLVDKFRLDTAKKKISKLIDDEKVIELSSWTDVQKIADFFGLRDRTGCNDHLRPDRGDFQFFIEEDISTEDLIFLFAGRQVVLDAAREDNGDNNDNDNCIRINETGDLDFAVKTFIIPLIN